MNLSAVVLTKNEEKNINDCIKSVSFCDEIIVIDDNSTDKTRETAKVLGAKVYKRRLGGNMAAQRNFALRQARGKWVLFIDADERVPPLLQKEIIQFTNNPLFQYTGFYLKRRDFIWGKEIRHGEVGNIKLLRLARRTSGKWIRRVHESWDIIGRTYLLKNPILHYPHPTMDKFLEGVNRWSSWHALANKKEGKRAILLKIIIWPLAHFAKNYIFKFGFLDGIQGFVLAIVMSFHSFLAWSKLWLLQKRT